jgi:small subunit ribosomal protein S20
VLKIFHSFSGGNSLALHPSVIKRHRQSEKRRTINVESKTRLRTLIKKARQAIESKNPEAVSTQLRAVNRALGKAVSKGTIKRNTASRWLSRLARSAKTAATA